MRGIDNLNNRHKALELRLQKMTYQEIADQIGISRQRVHQILTGYRPPRWWENKKAYKKRHSKTDVGKSQNRQYQRRYRNNIKILVLTHYGNGKLRCCKCGFKDIRALSIDHIEGGGGKHKISMKLKSDGFYRWLVANKYPEGYQTLCMNCQWIKRHENNELHKISDNCA